MTVNHHHAAAAAITALRYNGANLEVALHWLSAWRNGAPPRRYGFNTDALWHHKPAMMVCRAITVALGLAPEAAGASASTKLMPAPSA